MGVRAPEGMDQLTRQVRRQFKQRTGLDLAAVCGRCGLPTTQRHPRPRYLALFWFLVAKKPLRGAAFRCLLFRHQWRYV